MRAYVDANHAGDKLTRRSLTGYIVFLNMAPIYWHSKKQMLIETSTFGSEFIAMKQCCEFVRGLRYKLRMEGVAKGEWVTGYIKSDVNLSNLLTKSLPAGKKRDAEVGLCLYDL